MKLRLIPVVISLVLSSSALFGGWFVYHSVAVENPLSKAINQVKGIKHADIHLTADTAKISLQLDEQAKLGEIVQQIKEKGKNEIGSRALTWDVLEESSPQLEKWWSEALFSIAQSMENRQYAEIPETLKSMEASHKGLQATAEMDGENVYIHLQLDHQSKHIILPRVPSAMGVWPNE